MHAAVRRCPISANWRSLCRWLKLPFYSLTHADANLPLGNLQPFHQHSHKFPQFVLTCSCTRSTLSQMQPGMSTIILSPDDEARAVVTTQIRVSYPVHSSSSSTLLYGNAHCYLCVQFVTAFTKSHPLSREEASQSSRATHNLGIEVVQLSFSIDCTALFTQYILVGEVQNLVHFKPSLKSLNPFYCKTWPKKGIHDGSVVHQNDSYYTQRQFELQRHQSLSHTQKYYAQLEFSYLASRRMPASK